VGNSADEPEARGRQNVNSKWTVLWIVSIGVFMATLDSSIVNISLPRISSSFGVPLSGTVEWVIIGYLVVVAGTLLSLGRLSDIFGRKMLWVAGLGVFTAGSALCGAAPSLEFLVIARALQGIGGSMIMANSPALTTSAFPAGERGRALGIVAAVVAIGISAGPTLGGIITNHFSWRWIFYINVPVGIIGIIATLVLLSETGRSVEKQRFDPIGAILLCACLTCLMLGMSFGQELGWRSPRIIGLFVAGLWLFPAFIFYERSSDQPILDLTLFRNRLFSAALLSSFLSFMALFAVMFLMPFYLEELMGIPPQRAGLMMTAVPLTISIIAPVSGWLSDRYGSRILSSLGLAMSSAALWNIAHLTQHSSHLDIIWPLVMAGLGQALFQSPNNNAIMGSVPVNRLGIASSVLATVRTLGQGFSVAMAGAVFTSLGGSRAAIILTHEGLSTSAASTFTHAFQIAMLTCMTIAAIGVFTSLMRGGNR